jgi:hypothetical protein
MELKPSKNKDLLQPIKAGERASSTLFFIGPMVAVQAYLTIVLVAFAFGPWPWPVPSPVKLYSFLALSQLMLLVGFLSIRTGKAFRYRWRPRWRPMLYLSFVANGIWLYPDLVERTGHGYSGIDGVIAAIRAGFLEPGIAYKGSVEAMRTQTGASPVYLLTLLVGPILSLMFPLGVLYWNHIGFSAKVILISLILLDALTWVASGANKGLADIVILLPFLLFARAAMFGRQVPWKKMFLAAIVLAGLGIAFFVSFENGQIGRANNRVYNFYDFSAGIEADQEHPILRHLEPSTKYGVASLMSYITQGYYGLSLCLELPFVPTYGLGNAYYTASWANKYFGLSEISGNTYPARASVVFGWDDFGRWDSIYPWLASDLTFPGAIFFMGVLARLLASAWRDMVWGKHPIAASVFCSLIITCLYIPANNQVLGFPRSGIGFILSVIWWLSSRRRST